jgi:hypothetical protein
MRDFRLLRGHSQTVSRHARTKGLIITRGFVRQSAELYASGQ